MIFLTHNVMKNEQISTIHDFDFNLICEYFLDFDRQGPGSRASTLRAFDLARQLGEPGRFGEPSRSGSSDASGEPDAGKTGATSLLSAAAHIADLGCGTGGQTRTLAAATEARITGVDLFAPFVDRFNELSPRENVRGVAGSMDALPFADGSLDAIWCEGAVYHIGLAHALDHWRRFLKPGGVVALTDNTWLTQDQDRPAEIADFWREADPLIDTVPRKIEQIQRAGYEFLAAFALPPSEWEAFYAPQPEALRAFAARHPDSPTAQNFIANQRHERRMWDAHGAHYGYAFYIFRK